MRILAGPKHRAIPPNVVFFWSVAEVSQESACRLASTNALTTAGVATATSASVNNDRAGWTVGVGSEWMFAHQWSAKVEYLYMDYGHLTDGFIGAGSFAAVTINSHVTDNVVRAGVNYHFH